jgi:hypothetical protein
MSTTTCDVPWATSFFSGLVNISGPPKPNPVLRIEKNEYVYTAYLTSSAMPIQIQSIDTKGTSCMEEKGYTFIWNIAENVLYNKILTPIQKVYQHQGAKNFYDALKQCNVETEVKYSTQVSRRALHASLPWKDAL